MQDGTYARADGAGLGELVGVRRADAAENLDLHSQRCERRRPDLFASASELSHEVALDMNGITESSDRSSAAPLGSASSCASNPPATDHC
jgi:hypothetical protein